MIISSGNLSSNSLKDTTVIVTGGGRGIGFEAARALLWLGAKIVIAEIDEKIGRIAVNELESEFGLGNALFVRTDVGNEGDLDNLEKVVLQKFGKIDVVINNATLVSGIMGPVKEKSIDAWDRSYNVNLRGPILLARKFLPRMLERGYGVLVFVSSSGAVPFMGPYEVFKTAQVELAHTIAAEVESSGVYAFAIGPGIVNTPGFVDGGSQVADYMGITLNQLLEMNRSHELTAEQAGTGFAASIVLASKYHGQETSSIQVLRDIGIIIKPKHRDTTKSSAYSITSAQHTSEDVQELYQSVLKTYLEQSRGWKERNFFERKWMYRDFKKTTGLSVDEMMNELKQLGNDLADKSIVSHYVQTLEKLTDYYRHQKDLLKGFEKNPRQLEENLGFIDRWIEDCLKLISMLTC
jgi:NAD(P)-dependent dehydrogenase (short-subunit alcohol dehydrogenase family)